VLQIPLAHSLQPLLPAMTRPSLDALKREILRLTFSD
jgi:hypothetical protein